MEVLRLENVKKTYSSSDDPAVNGLNITVEHGEIITLLGPSGCGKTTTLRLIAGFERPDTGKIVINDRVVSSPTEWVPPEKRGVGMVFQDYALFPHLTVIKNVAFGLLKDNRKQKTQRVDEILTLVGLDQLGSRYPHELSGGQQQRVALARALAPKPALILLDEPFSNLDAELRKQMRDEISDIIKQSAISAIIVSHDQRDALAISDRIVLMRGGKVEQTGTPRQIYLNPRSDFAANFMGHSNIITGVVASDQSRVLTPLGSIACSNIHGLKAGAQAILSIRPQGLELDPCGSVKGIVTKATFTGSAIEALITIDTPPQPLELTVHMNPHREVLAGQHLSFRVLKEFISVVN